MSKGSQPAGNVTTTQGPPQYEFPYIGTALNQAGSLLSSGGPAFYPGQQVAPFSPIQEQAFTGINNLDSGLTQGEGNPLENAMFNQAALGTQGQLASEFAGAGRNLNASMPLRSDQLNNLATSFYGNNYQNTVQNAMNAGQQQLGIGNQIQQQAQQNIGANRNLFDYYQAQPYQQLGQYEQFLGGVTPGMQSSSPYFNNPTANALGTGLGALGLYNGLGQAGLLGSKGASTGAAGTGAGSAMEAALGAMSDRRLKEDIKRVGTTENGLPIYTFRYKGHHQVNMGVMADEVKEKFPEAVIKHPSGYDLVDYGKIG